MSAKKNKIGILTSGGDAPGLNAVIRAVVITAVRQYGWEVVGIHNGFEGLLDETKESLTPREIQIVGRQKQVPYNGDLVQTARGLGICLGE